MENIFIGIYTIIIGVIVYLIKKIFENQIDLRKDILIHRFSAIYTEKLSLMKEIYRKVVVAEKSLEHVMRPIKLNDNRSTEELEKEAVDNINALFNYFDENEIIFNDKTVTLIRQLQTNFHKAWKSYNGISFFTRNSDAWNKAINESIDVYNTTVAKDIPALKQELKEDFQNQLRILEKN
ncbi:hypothetical protein FACS189440_02190 [Bacteroidia bacterium]|nr:hypothetical protein FACS189423_02120 [Bacteroidia bacterium]GHT45700.1 hypothetical protein FACS189440_02190 [Bacteroidia bacterium]